MGTQRVLQEQSWGASSEFKVGNNWRGARQVIWSRAFYRIAPEFVLNQYVGEVDGILLRMRNEVPANIVLMAPSVTELQSLVHVALVRVFRVLWSPVQGLYKMLLAPPISAGADFSRAKHASVGIDC